MAFRIIDFFRDIFAGKDTVYVKEHLDSERYKLAIEDFSIQMAINMIAGLLAKCEFKTYINNKETKADEYYLWNVEPNVNQNSSEFIQELIAKLFNNDEALVVEVNGQMLIADSFNRTPYALLPDTFSGVSCRGLNFDRTFSMNDVLYFRLNNQDIRVLLSHLMTGYSQLLDMAVGKYKRSGGRKGVAKIDKTISGDPKRQAEIDDIFKNRFRKYFTDENAVIHMPNGIDYQEVPGEGSKKSTSEINDIVLITKEALSRVAQALRIPPALLQGDISDVSKIIDELLTICIDPLVDLIQTEIIRKRYGKASLKTGTYLKIDTTRIKHIDIFDIAQSADKLISDGIYSVDELREKIGELPLNTWWSKKHWMTKNNEDMETGNLGTGGEINSETS